MLRSVGTTLAEANERGFHTLSEIKVFHPAANNWLEGKSEGWPILKAFLFERSSIEYRIGLKALEPFFLLT